MDAEHGNAIHAKQNFCEELVEEENVEEQVFSSQRDEHGRQGANQSQGVSQKEGKPFGP